MSDLTIPSTSSDKSAKPLIVAEHTFSSPNEVFFQLRTWATELPRETYIQHFHEALGEVNRAIDVYDLVRDAFLVNMWSVGKDTLGNDFARIRKKNRHIWSKAEQAQLGKFLLNGKAKATAFLAINTAQGWRGAVSRLATACADYDEAMKYIVHALVQRLQHVGRGKSRYLDPGFVDIQLAIDLYKANPRRPPVGNEVLAELGVQRNSMGLLSTVSEIIEAPIGGPGFEWAGTEPQLPLPQTIIEELSDLSSDSEYQDTESLQGTQVPPATTVEPAATPTSTIETMNTVPTSTQRQKRKRETVPVLTASSSGQRQPSQRTTSDSHTSPHGDTSRLIGSPGAPSSLQNTATTPTSPTPSIGNTPQGKEGETATETHPETRIRDDEAAHKLAIMEDLLKRFKASSIDPKRVLAEGSLQGIDIYDWWEYQGLVDKKTMADCAVIELKRFEHHYKNQLDSYQFSLFQQLAEIDPVLVCQYGSGTTLIPIKSVDLNTAVVLRPTLLPVPVIMELSKGTLHSKPGVVQAIQKIRSEREPVPGDVRDLSPRAVTFVEHSPTIQGISPLTDAILCRRSYLEMEVQEEIKILLGEDRDVAWQWINDWRKAAYASVKLSYKLLMEVERTRFEDQAFMF
ncbi:hypothetical protein BDV38DRAFT_273142 [Aspergillus pseudotamarii]|uniref:Uncharacterized protein n=1 Tax=Aspergillus pseudotamarii TaxID=132259 RepID=A0A5N6SNH4_ASPPS|nr:uncharacterized protein BDV38DRAFT_273142 [Aspergillus pseudotamarii]KAE8134923.1 hypothetical protein BDV38DRAFT_273142 [Aspergillus pseudotamarii]